MHPSKLMPDIFAQRARSTGNSEAVYDYDANKRYTFKEMDRRATSLAAFLTEEIGLKKGDRVAFVCENNIAFLDAFFATYKTGIIMTTYNCMMGKTSLLALAENEDPRVFFYSGNRPEVMEYYREQDPTRDYICILGERDERDKYTYEEAINYTPKGDIHYDLPEYEDIQMLIHTGGTTGAPKAAMMSFRAIMYNALAGIVNQGVKPDDTVHVYLPFFHTAGWNVLMLQCLLCGGRVILTSEFNPEVTLQIIRDESPTLALGIELMYQALAMHPDFETTDFSCFRFMLSGAAPLSRETLEIYWRRRIRLGNAYGMTEVGPNNLFSPVEAMTFEDMRLKWNAAGKPLIFNELRIVDEDGNDVKPNEHGELLFRGNLLFSGYWNDEENTKELMKDGWAHTGDVGYMDDDGFVYIAGREKNMFISGGENIYPIEIEQMLETHPEVQTSVVIGVPDDHWGEVGKALVMLNYNVEPTEEKREELKQYVRDEISSIKTPQYIQFVSVIPVNDVGKQDLNQIKKEYGYPGETEEDKPQEKKLEIGEEYFNR